MNVVNRIEIERSEIDNFMIEVEWMLIIEQYELKIKIV